MPMAMPMPTDAGAARQSLPRQRVVQRLREAGGGLIAAAAATLVLTNI
jgi:hypothetical protein